MDRRARECLSGPLAATAVLIASCAIGHVLPVRAQVRPPSEYAVKAAFLYQFGNFVEWPERPDPTFVICVMGADPFGPLLDQTVAGAPPIGGTSVSVRRVIGVTDSGPCRILFISPSENRRLREVLERLADDAVLTVGEGRLFVERGGMIGFEIEDDRVRFDVNLGAAREAGLTVSSQLLGVARRVIEAEVP